METISVRVACIDIKKLGVKIGLDLTWNYHIDHIYGKAAKWLYSLRVFKRTGVASSNIINIYKWSVRSSIPAYAVPAWQDIPETLFVK